MAANARSIIAAGFERAYIGPVDSAGYLIGSTITAPVAGDQAGSAMKRILGVKTSDLTITEPDFVTVTGDDGALGTFIFDPNQNPSFTIEVGVNDIDLAALVQTSAVDDIGDVSIGVLQTDAPTLIDCALVFMRHAKYKAGTASDGAAQWEGVIIPKAQLIPLGSQNFTERQASSFRYRVVAQPAAVMPWGQPLGSTAGDLDVGATLGNIFPFTAENRVTVHRFTGDGTEVAFTLGQTPASVSKAYVFVEGALQTYTTDYTITGSVVTFEVGSKPANGEKIEVFYEFTI